MILTDEQVEKLADALIDTGKNVYGVAKQMFDVEIDDSVFEQLEKQAKIFKCDNCDQWLGTDYESPDFYEMCEACAEDMDQED